MSFKKSMIVAVVALGILSACGEKKTKEIKVDAAEVEKVAAEMKEEASEMEAEVKTAKSSVADSLKKVDSLQQVKSHGHAH